MAKPISNDLRTRVCQAIAEGLSCRQAAARFKVSVSSAIRWQARLRDRGSAAPDAVGGDVREPWRREGRDERENEKKTALHCAAVRCGRRKAHWNTCRSLCSVRLTCVAVANRTLLVALGTF